MNSGTRPEDDGYFLYVIGTFPLLTTTFIDRELGALIEDGVDVKVVSIRRFAGRLSPGQSEMASRVRYVLPVSFGRLVRFMALAIVSRPIALALVFLRLTFGDHPSLRARLRTVGHFVLGVYVWGIVLSEPPRHVHAHFVDRATTVAMVVSTMFDIGYSVTAHANDIYVDPVLLVEKATPARFVATCTAFNASHLRELAPRANVELVYHGLDMDLYPIGSAADDGTGRMVSVAQLKEKKGLTYLISACRILADAGVPFQCNIIGDGPLLNQLQEQIQTEGLTNQVRLVGSLPHDQVIEQLRSASVFVLPSVVADDGDRDGIPNVILEAMAVTKPVVSTSVSGIPEAVTDGVTGVLVPPADPSALAYALGELLGSPARRSAMGTAGRAKVEEEFDVRQNARILEQLLMS